MDNRTSSLALQWRTQANQHEQDAETYRLMAVEDDVNDRPDMRVRNLRVASHAQGKADALRACARQLATELVQ